MIKKTIASLMIFISAISIGVGIYFLLTMPDLDFYAAIILFGLPGMGLVLTFLFLKNRISTWVLLLPFALAYIFNSFR